MVVVGGGWWFVGIVTKNRNEMMNGFRGEKVLRPDMRTYVYLR